MNEKTQATKTNAFDGSYFDFEDGVHDITAQVLSTGGYVIDTHPGSNSITITSAHRTATYEGLDLAEAVNAHFEEKK